MDTTTTIDAQRARMRLLQLVSPSLPVGAFAYSQGIEWAVEAGWISGAGDLEDWLQGLLESSIGQWEVPMLARMYNACERGDGSALVKLSQRLLASRESRELRQEEIQRGRALATLLADLGVERAQQWRDILSSSQMAGFALATSRWRIPLAEAAEGYVWAWLENLVLAAVKIIPLGQTAGQRVLLHLSEGIPEAVCTALALADDDIGASSPALAIASSLHETQYTRLFRS
ncbi:MAG: urease accessory protein UreF [Chromatiales bacterium]|nr:urease accessory protein UreF [Chromatiales bacterium]